MAAPGMESDPRFKSRSSLSECIQPNESIEGPPKLYIQEIIVRETGTLGCLKKKIDRGRKRWPPMRTECMLWKRQRCGNVDESSRR